MFYIQTLKYLNKYSGKYDVVIRTESCCSRTDQPHDGARAPCVCVRGSYSQAETTHEFNYSVWRVAELNTHTHTHVCGLYERKQTEFFQVFSRNRFMTICLKSFRSDEMRVDDEELSSSSFSASLLRNVLQIFLSSGRSCGCRHVCVWCFSMKGGACFRLQRLPGRRSQWPKTNN